MQFELYDDDKDRRKPELYQYSAFQNRGKGKGFYYRNNNLNDVGPNFSKKQKHRTLYNVVTVMPKKVPLLTSTNNRAASNNNLTKFKRLQTSLVNLNTQRFQLKNSIKQYEKIKVEKRQIELALEQCNKYKVKLVKLEKDLNMSKKNVLKLQLLETQYKKAKDMMSKLKH